MESFNRQKNDNQKQQYCSNIALKTNMKLGRVADKACAWEWSNQLDDGTADTEKEWLDQAPTMIVGLSTASGMS
jgi:hypothetical protein